MVESEKGSFAPMLFLTTGGAGPKCNEILKQLASKISDKRQEKYGYVVNHIRVKLRFALLKSVLIAIRGTRGKIAKERLLGHVSLNMVPHEAGYET